MDILQREQGTYRFGRSSLDPSLRALFIDGERVKLAERLFDVLLCLVTNHGRVAERDELLRSAWAGRTVEDNNVGQAIFALRKILKAEGHQDSIVTVPGRGYRLAVPVEYVPKPAETACPEMVFHPEPPELSSALQPPGSRRTRVASALGLAALSLACALVWYIGSRSTHLVPPPHSVAVMAFANLSGDPGQAYFSDGLAEDLIEDLGGVPGLTVAARTSAFSFKGQAATISEIARTLDVASVLEGSVQKDGTRLRIGVGLIDAASGVRLWSNHYDLSESTVFEIQGAIAEAVTASLEIRLLGNAGASVITAGGTTIPQALDAYLHAMNLAKAQNLAANRAALASFRQALSLDNKFARAHAGLASSLLWEASFFGGRDVDTVREAVAEAVSEAGQAIALAPNLAQAHAILGDALEQVWDFRRAAGEYTRAMVLAPNDSFVQGRFAFFQLASGHRDAAIEAAERAVALDPLSAEAYADLTLIDEYEGRSEEGSAALRHAEELGFSGAEDTDLRADNALMRADFQAVLKTCAGEEDYLQRQFLAIAFHELGHQHEAQAVLDRMFATQGDTAAYNYATIYARWGQMSEALKWLETAFRLHDPGLIYVQAGWLIDPLRRQPRFGETVRHMQFPP